MTIFPIEYHSTSNVENTVISSLDMDSRFSFMLVNKAALAILDNGHFQKLFKTQYPELVGSSLLFLNLRYFHPEICWKVACYALAHPEFFPRNPCYYGSPLVMLPAIKEMVKGREREIEGGGPEDMDSPYNKARSAIEGANKKRDAMVHAGVPVVEAEKEILEGLRCMAVLLGLEVEKSRGAQFCSQIERHAKHFDGGGNEVLQFKWKLWHHDVLVGELLFARNAMRINELPKLEESFLRANSIRHLTTFHPGDPGLARAVQEMTDLLQSFPTGARILQQFRGLNEAGVGIWNLLSDLIDVEREAIKTCREALSTIAFIPHYLNHPAQLSPVISYFADDEGFDDWRRQMQDFVIRLLPPSYLKSPGCDLDVFRTYVGSAGKEAIGSDEITMLADHVRQVIAPNQEEVEF